MSREFNFYGWDKNGEPNFVAQRVQTKCCHCGKVIIFPVPPEFVRHSSIEDCYRKTIGSLMREYGEIANEIESRFGENFVAQIHADRIREMIARIKREMGKFKQ